MVNEPARCGPVLTATVKLTVPLPAPDAPDVMLIHAALLWAVQLQFPVDETLTMPLLPDAEKFCEVGLRL
jgi:hypothetical protein